LEQTNEFGELRIDMDVQTDSLIHDNLKKSKVVHMSLSEERPYPTILSKKGSYIVTFDPIEGSNIIESKYLVIIIRLYINFKLLESLINIVNDR
jgi:fructose-1,6-bisphosphatase